MAPEQIIEKIQRYREYLEVAARKNNDQQILAVLEKLDKLPISLDHLHETGIGKAVNGYRKFDDPIGQKAKSIVNKWKGLVQAAMAEESSQKSCKSPATADKESDNLSCDSAADGSPYVPLELHGDVHEKRKESDCRDHSAKKHGEMRGKRHSDLKDAPAMKKHREIYPQEAVLNSANDYSQSKQRKVTDHRNRDALSKDALHKKSDKSYSSNSTHSRETEEKHSYHSPKRKDHKQASLNHAESDASTNSGKDVHKTSCKGKTSTHSNHEDSLNVKSYTEENAAEISESRVKRKWHDESDSDSVSKWQHRERSPYTVVKEKSEKNTLPNSKLSGSLSKTDFHSESSLDKNSSADKSSFKKHKSERESSSKTSSHKESSKTVEHHKDLPNKHKSSSKVSSSRHSSDREGGHNHSSRKDVPSGKSGDKHLSVKKSTTSDNYLKTYSSMKDISDKDSTNEISSRQSFTKTVTSKLPGINENKDNSSQKKSSEKHLLQKKSLDRSNDSMKKDFLENNNSNSPMLKHHSGSKFLDEGLPDLPRKEQRDVSVLSEKLNFKDEKKFWDNGSDDENSGLNFFEALSKTTPKLSPSRRNDDVNAKKELKSSASRNKSSKGSHRSMLDRSVTDRPHNSHAGHGSGQDPDRNKKKVEKELEASPKNQHRSNTNQISIDGRKHLSKLSGNVSKSSSLKSEKNKYHGSKVSDQKSEPKESSNSRVRFDIATVGDDLDSDDDDESTGMSFEACLNYNASTSQKKSSAKSMKSSTVVGSKEKQENKPLQCKTLKDFSLNQSLIDVPLPKEVEFDLELDELPLYPSMRQEIQSKTTATENNSNTERRYGQKMIYSGRKQATVPVAVSSLFDACIQVLQENVDDITCVGYIPTDILMPVLKICNVVQLERLEFFNPHFVGDTEELWKSHCNRDFRGEEPEDMESWRELHMRLQDARKQKLAKIAKNVKANQMRADKEVSRVQLTYVDGTMTRGNRIKKTTYSGAINFPVACTGVEETGPPRSKQEILDELKNQISKAPQRRRGGWGAPKIEQKSVTKPSAPLMQKTLQFFKKLRR